MADSKPLIPQGEAAIRVMMMPRDTNGHGTIFGGVILSYIDQAGAIEARRQTPQKVVTVAIDSVEFHEPVFVGDLLSLHTETVRRGRTSVTVQVSVFAQRRDEFEVWVPVTSAQLVFVAVDGAGRPTPLHSSREDDRADYVI